MKEIAEEYVKLVLGLGVHDANYVDAYYGPPEWKAEAEAHGLTPEQIGQRAKELTQELERADLGFVDAGLAASAADEMTCLRCENLLKQLMGLRTRSRMAAGETLAFDAESEGLYDVVDPGHTDAYYEDVLTELEPMLPGEGSLTERFDRYRTQFEIPRDRLEAVFDACISAARERTKRYIDMPEGEDFRIEYVDKQVWGAYNWYQGQSHSLIQINTDFPVTVVRALHLACHEGYPGHHVYNALLERDLARERGWMEFTVYPLFSPQSLIAEGTAEYGAELAFSEAEQLAFERDDLFPLAGVDPGLAEPYAQIRKAVARLGYAPNDAAKRYLDGHASREETIEWLSKYSLTTPPRAEQRVRFIEVNRSYVVTYNLGLDMVRAHVEARAKDVPGRWKVFEDLLRTPRTPSSLVG